MKTKMLVPILFVVVLGLWLASWYFVINNSTLQEWAARGQFGDMFGAVNALFSGLAFAGVIIAILLQREELELQRKELVQTREELHGQKEQLKLQNETFRLQQFEATFFQMLSLHNDIVGAIDIDATTEHASLTGRDSFVGMHRSYVRCYAKDKEKFSGKSENEIIEYSYAELHLRHQMDLGHYFRVLYNIIKFVDHCVVIDKKFYTNIVRAQLSNHEIVLLFYNCLSSHGKEKFRPLVIKYALLKNIPKGLLMHKEHIDLYPPEAYGKQVPSQA